MISIVVDIAAPRILYRFPSSLWVCYFVRLAWHDSFSRSLETGYCLKFSDIDRVQSFFRIIKDRGEGSLFTRAHRPEKLIWFEEHPDLAIARRRERQLKGWTRRKKEALFRGDLKALKKR